MNKIIAVEISDIQSTPPLKRRRLSFDETSMPKRPPRGASFARRLHREYEDGDNIPSPDKLGGSLPVSLEICDEHLDPSNFVAHGNFMDVYKVNDAQHGIIVRKTFTNAKGTHFKKHNGKPINSGIAQKKRLITKAFRQAEYMVKGDVPVVPILNKEESALAALMIESPYIANAELLTSQTPDSQSEVVIDILHKVIKSWGMAGIGFYFPDIFETDNIVKDEDVWKILDVVDDHEQEGIEFICCLKQMHQNKLKFSINQIASLEASANSVLETLDSSSSKFKDVKCFVNGLKQEAFF
jgi:hypothetical protein